jgi:hypothetical protein
MTYRRPYVTSAACLCLLSFNLTCGENSPVTFVDVAVEAGLTEPNVWGGVEEKTYIIEAKGSGLAFYDYDHDGWLDVYVTNGVRFGEKYSRDNAPTSHLYKNNRDGSFSDVTSGSGLARTGWQTGVCVGDFDNDGRDDLFAGFWGQNALYKNNGDGTFTDVLHQAGLVENEERWSSGCSWLDYDRDGFLDLYVANYIKLDIEEVPAPDQEDGCKWKGIPVLCGPQGLPGDVDTLFHNNGDGTFTDVSRKAGVLEPGPRFSISSIANDFNNDGWPDIYVSVDSEPSLLFLNRQDGTFEEVGLIAGCAYGENGQEQAGMGLGVADYNSDGWLDIFKTNFQHDTCNLYRNNGDGTFSDVSATAGISVNTVHVNWGAGFIDYDNDGWADILHVTGHVYPRAEKFNVASPLKTPRIVYRNLGNGRFRDVSAHMGSGITQRFASRGCAFGDYDNDGDVDVLVLNMNDRPSLLRNEGGNQNHRIGVKLIGKVSNRSAIGARVRVVTGNHEQILEVQSGGSVMSQNDLRLNFGVGKKQVIDMIEVKWPNQGVAEAFLNIDANQLLTIREGDGIVAADPLGP